MSPSKAGSGQRILLVEDNPDDELLTLKALEQAKILNEIVVVRDGVEALEYLSGKGAFEGRDPSDPPALVLLDLELPRLDGHGVLKYIRDNEATRLVPVVMLTCSDEESDLLKSYRCGANSYVRKPVDFVQFSAAVQQIGMYWLLLNETVPRSA